MAAVGSPSAGARLAGVKPAVTARATSTDRATVTALWSPAPAGRFQSTWVRAAVVPARSIPPEVGATLGRSTSCPGPTEPGAVVRPTTKLSSVDTRRPLTLALSFPPRATNSALARACASASHWSRKGLGFTGAPSLGRISKWQWGAPPAALPESPTKPMTVPLLTTCPLWTLLGIAWRWAQYMRVPSAVWRFHPRPPRPPLVYSTAPLAAATVGVP